VAGVLGFVEALDALAEVFFLLEVMMLCKKPTPLVMAKVEGP
jgi:hypothetical protein